ncbi:MAG TPA: peptidylprolyl isomerase [Acidobacteriota bacterium]|jgi:cyclophilin family peptidyl-prolyl cis-trans isomerase|nr:peptidylprolyl isomerase [Acidobacteriota bacterium]HNR39399.1 peptidylprolyl isomerase [Acidobacteriota bacterium]HNU00220.1 peptidylprolyl isomerase [Acidobacteriota bacterium]HPB29282.1 peptidylprolyl isomerase [Acidobacteriota bacterium]HQP74814.1 peptidylprolyl isomerase [Acidobacteriota bacterium]
MISARHIRPGLAALLLVLALAACGGPAPAETEQPAPGPSPAATPEPPPLPASNRMVVETPAGAFTIELKPDQAPQTVARIKRLAADGFYTGTAFHRIIAGSLIQGGDPLSRDADPYNDGFGTTGEFLPFEVNNLPMTAGAVAMARGADDRNSASCQFFVCVKNHPEWQGEYTVFGHVVEGMDAVRKIAAATVGTGNLAERPIIKQTIQRIEFR